MRLPRLASSIARLVEYLCYKTFWESRNFVDDCCTLPISGYSKYFLKIPTQGVLFYFRPTHYTMHPPPSCTTHGGCRAYFQTRVAMGTPTQFFSGGLCASFCAIEKIIRIFQFSRFQKMKILQQSALVFAASLAPYNYRNRSVQGLN